MSSSRVSCYPFPRRASRRRSFPTRSRTAARASARRRPAGSSRKSSAPNASRPQQVDYYQRRERAAFTLGEAAARIEALRRLVALTETPDKPSPYVSYLWRELWRFGSQTEALEMGEALVSHRAATPQQRLTWTVNLARDYVTIGKRSRAEELLKQVEAEGKGLQDTRGPHMAAYTTIATEELRATVLNGQNDYEGAHAAIRRALDTAPASPR